MIFSSVMHFIKAIYDFGLYDMCLLPRGAVRTIERESFARLFPPHLTYLRGSGCWSPLVARRNCSAQLSVYTGRCVRPPVIFCGENLTQ